MYCPRCRDEFRPGFTRCASCNVELVEDLSAVPPAAEPPAEAEVPQAFVPMATYCGFLSLDEAREARDRLREAGIRWEIVIRDSSRSGEEYWLNVERSRFDQAASLLGYDVAGEPAESLVCDQCGSDVAAEEKFCPHCGSRFEEER